MAQVISTTKISYVSALSNGRHEVIADEPIEKGGTDTGFTPRELLFASLASCSSITMTMYANRKGWDVREIKVEVEHVEVGEEGVVNKKISFVGNLDEKQIERLKVIAGKCPIHKTLEGCMEIRTEIVN